MKSEWNERKDFVMQHTCPLHQISIHYSAVPGVTNIQQNFQQIRKRQDWAFKVKLQVNLWF